jgi:ribokinase
MIIVFGSINVDLVAQVENLPAPGETLAGTALAVLPGGKGANQALAARRAGAEVCMAGAVGRDAFAAIALANLETSGIDLTGVAAVDAATGVALIHVDRRGENAITVIAGANELARASQVPDNMLDVATTLLMQLEVPATEVAALVRRAHAHLTRVIVNASPAMALPDDLLRGIDVLVVNAPEAAALAASLGVAATPEEFARGVAGRHGNAVVVTLGGRGALACQGDERIHVDAPHVATLDTTGAGDALTGALAAALDRGAPLRMALAEGVAAGALACTGQGAQAALPDQRAIRALAITI